MSANYASIFDVESGEDTISIRGKTYQLHATGSKDALILRKRFPDFKRNIENLQFLVDDENVGDDALTDEVVDRLVRVVEFTNAMTAVALGEYGKVTKAGVTSEQLIDRMFSDQEKAAIISKAQGLSVDTPDEGFSTRSA